MLFIPGPVIAALTFPGIVVHEIAHQLFCQWFRVAIIEVCYFRMGNPAGYVVHEPPPTLLQSFFISIGPLVINTIIGSVIAFPGVLPLYYESGTFLDYFLVWLGGSIAMHAFPSTGDAKALWSSLKNQRKSMMLKILVAPIVIMIYLGAFASVIWLDFIYAAAVCWAIPIGLVRLLMSIS